MMMRRLDQVVFLGALLVATLAIGLFLQRALYIDEVSSLLNYPAERAVDLIAPLPYAQQAAPPFFNAVSSLIWPFSVTMMRLIMTVLVAGLALLSIGAALGWRLVPLTAALLAIAANGDTLLKASELKFYGLELAAAAVLLAWIIRRDPTRPLRPGDALILLGAMLLGISTLILCAAALAVVLLKRLLSGSGLTATDMLWSGVFLAGAIGYYVQIQYATQFQISSFTVYARDGLKAVLGLWESLATLYIFDASQLPLTLVFLAMVLVALWRGTPEMRDLALFFGIAMLAFSALAFLGKYPAFHPRHITWTLGLWVFGTAIAVTTFREDLIEKLWGKLVLAAMVGLLFLGSAWNIWNGRDVRNIAGSQNDVLLSWLEKAPGSDVLLYYGASRLIDLAERRGAALGHHRFHGGIQFESGPVDPDLVAADLSDKSLIEDHIRTALTGPSGFRDLVYGAGKLGNFSPYAEFVLASRPETTPVLLLATHMTFRDRNNPRYRALIETLEAQNCTFERRLAVRAGFILAIDCPARP